MVVALPAFALVPLGHGIYRQIILGQPWGNSPFSDAGLISITAVIFLVNLGTILLFLSARLETEVRSDGVFYRFFPFHRSFHCVAMESVRRFYAKTYSPIREYGGWGIRRKWPGTGYGLAFNVSGNQGVLFEFSNGSTLLIGSQKAEELARAIEKLQSGKSNE